MSFRHDWMKIFPIKKKQTYKSGYSRTVKVINLNPELDSSKKELSKIMELNEHMLGFNFQIIFEWMNEKKNLDTFIDNIINNRSEEINDLFESNGELKEKIVNRTEKIENLKFTREELDFLQKNNIIIRTAHRKNAWHDRLVEKAFEELRNKK